MAADEDSEEEICCNACGFEASFVPEGMLPCERCGDAHYCSVECLQWDWNQGGHSKSCVDKRPPADESSSSEGDRASSNLLPVTLGDTPATPKANSSFSGEEESIMSMDVSKLFGMSPGSFDNGPSNGGANPERYRIKSDDTPKGDVKGQKSFWENKLKSGSATSGPVSPVKSKGNTSKLASFFENQSQKKSPEKMPAHLSAAKKKDLGKIASSPIDGGHKKSPDDDESQDDSMGDDNFKFGIGQYQVSDSMDDSFDFMDTSVQTSGLKSIVEESDSWSSEDPDSEGSWRSRTPFELASDDGDSDPPPKPKPVLTSKKSASSMLGEPEMSDTEEDEHLWDTRQTAPSLLNQRGSSQQPNYVETDDFYEEESMEEDEESLVEEESMEEEEGSMDEYEEDVEDSYEHDDENAEEIEESQDETIDHSDRTPDEMVRKVDHSREHPDRLRPQRYEKPSSTPRFMPNYGLPQSSAHSEPAVNCDKDGSNGSTRKRKSLGSFSADSSSRGAASLLDFRQLYTERDAQTSTKDESSSSRLKDFRAAYNGSSLEDSVSSAGEIPDLFSANPRSAPVAATMGTQSEDTGKPSNEALKTSLNKALRDFEKLYGPEAARAAVERLTQAVAEDDTGGSKPANAPSTTDKSPAEKNVRSLSPSSWAMPSGVSVSSSDTDGIPISLPSGLSGKHSRSRSMPLVGGTDLTASLVRENSFSSWALTGASIGSGGASKHPESETRREVSSAAVPHVDVVREESHDFSTQSEWSGNIYSGKPSDSNTAFGLNTGSPFADDDQDSNRGRASSSENWLAELASSCSEIDRNNVPSHKPTVETVDKSTDDEDEMFGNEKVGFLDDESMGDPFSHQADPNRIMSEPGRESSNSRSKNNQEHGEEAVVGISTTSPRYMKYRDGLAKNHYGEDAVRKLEFNDPEVVLVESDGKEGIPNSHLSASSQGDRSPQRYMTYRAKLATIIVADRESSEDPVDTFMSERNQDVSRELEVASMSALPKGDGKSHFQEYRSTLAKRVHHQEDDGTKSDISAKKSGELTDGDVGDISLEPRYQKYRSHLATSVSATGQENTANESEDHDDLVPIHPLTDTPTSAPVYQQYRSALANAILANSTTDNDRPSPATLLPLDIASSQNGSGNTKEIAQSSPSAMGHDASRVLAASNAGPSTPRYAAHRTGLKDQISDQSSSEQIQSAAMVAAVSQGTVSKPTGDDELEDRLTNFLSKNEKGKKSQEAWSDPVEIPSSPHTQNKEGPPPDLVGVQARKIAAAIASSQLYAGQQKGGLVPEKKALEPTESLLEPMKEPFADPEVARDPEGARDPEVSLTDPVGVTCRSSASSRGKRSTGSGEENDREYGLKLFKRNRCFFYGLLVCLLVAMPLGIGLGIALSGDDSEDRIVQVSGDPTPTTAPNPGLRATPTQTPMPSSDPTIQPTTLSPTTETALPTPFTWSPTEAPTSLPTNAPTADEQVLLNLLSSVSPDNGANIETDGSPQNDAFAWLAGSNPLASLSVERTIQRYALATIFFSTDGPSWSQSNNWLTDVDECFWFSGSGGSSCDENGQYVTLNLGFNGLMGSIPAEIGLLTGLRRLDISGGIGPGIGGVLPTTMSSLASLETFVATDNAISGPLFADVGAWSNLRILNLKNNDMTGPLPSSMGNLINLDFMDISFNAFSGPVPNEIGSMVNLVTLNLGTNSFTSLPASMGNLVSLVSFDASFNSLSGPLFEDWAGLASLRTIDVNSNSLAGSLPASIGAISGLLQLDLSNNRFNSNIPATYGNLSSLLILRLNSNLLIGNVPTSLGNLQSVTEVRVDDNNLAGAVPSQVCDSFEVNAPKFYLDCATPELSCPPGICCTYCCTDGVGCECVLAGTPFAFLC